MTDREPRDATRSSSPGKVTIWWAYLRYFDDMKGGLAISVVGTALMSLTAVPVVYLIRSVFDVAIPQGRIGYLVVLGGALLALRVATAAASMGLRALNIRIIEEAVLRLRCHVLERLYELPRSYYTSMEDSTLHTAIVQDSNWVKSASSSLVGRLLPGVVSAAVLLGLLLFLNWVLCLVMLAVVPLLLLGNHLVSREVERRVHLFREAFRRFAGGMAFVLEAMDFTRAEASEEREIARQRRTLEELRDREGAMAIICALHGQVQGSVVAISAILILVLGGFFVADGTTTLGSFFAFYFVASLLNQSVREINEVIPDILRGNDALMTLLELVETREGRPYRGARRIEFSGNVEFVGVDFGYGRDRVLHSVDLRVTPGSRIGLTGVNGVGKSTLLYLLLGFYRPDRGAVLADGVPYDELDVRDLRRSMGVVFQTPFLFAGTIRENLTYGRPESTEAEILEACDLALASGFIRDLPRALDSEVGEGGMFLSGGQRQRLALARAILRRPRLLILDEPANHLDPDAVAAFVANLAHLPFDPALICVTHEPLVLHQVTERYAMREGRLLHAGLGSVGAAVVGASGE